MATLTETKTTQQTPVVDAAAALHNAQINERYLRLKNAVDEQFEEARVDATTPRASVLAPERPAEVIAPDVERVEYGHTRVESPLFTAETLDRTLQRNAEVAATYAPEMPAYAPVEALAVQTESYSLTSAAKKLIAAFVGTVTVMLSVIGINSRIISNNELKIAAVQAQNAEVVAQIEELRAQIEIAESEEAIAEFAQANGMVKGN
ncbi:MAG: hypothetical protein IJX81_03665 [Clostridia bacterium]|nr:hypothetical protein [Clostridia bacterium]